MMRGNKAMTHMAVALAMLILPAAIPCAAQTSTATADSIKRVLAGVRAEKRVDVLNALCLEFRRADAAAARSYGQQAQKLAESLRYDLGLAEAYRCQGVVEYVNGKHAAGLELCTQALALFKAADSDKGVADALNNLGTLHRLMGEYAQAIDYHNQALAVRQKLNDKAGIAGCYTNLGLAYYRMGDYARALSNHETALKLDREAKNLAGVAAGYANIGVVQFARGDYAAATEFFKNYLQMEKAVPDRQGRAEALGNLGMLSYKRGQYNDAITYALRSQVLAQALNATPMMRENCLTLAESYAANRNFNKAYEFYRLYSTLKDSLQREESGKRLQVLEKRLRTAEGAVKTQQEEIGRLTLLSIVAGVIAVAALALAGVLLARRKRAG
jgi:tetratricopeptide (TPR) repeat protein